VVSYGAGHHEYAFFDEGVTTMPSVKETWPTVNGHRETDCGPLLREIRRTLRIPGGGARQWFGTNVYLDLIPLCGDFDAAMVLSQAIYWASERQRYVPRDNEGDLLVDKNGDIVDYGWLIDFEKPEATLGIPRRRFEKVVARLSQKNLLDRAPPHRWKPSPGSAANPNWRVREGDWLLDVHWTRKMLEATDKGKLWMPWSFRAMMTGRKASTIRNGRTAKGVKDMENGNGAHLLMRLMKHHTRKDEGWNCNRIHEGRRWSGDTRKVWAEKLRIGIKQFDRLVLTLAEYIAHDWRGARWSRETLLRPRLANIKKQWNRQGKPYWKYIRQETD
jgi:hypothetical protein